MLFFQLLLVSISLLVVCKSKIINQLVSVNSVKEIRQLSLQNLNDQLSLSSAKNRKLLLPVDYQIGSPWSHNGGQFGYT